MPSSLEQVIDRMERGLAPPSPLLREDERLRVNEGGAYAVERTDRLFPAP